MKSEINQLARAVKGYKQARKLRKAADKILRKLPSEAADEVSGAARARQTKAGNRVAFWAREVALVHDVRGQRQQQLTQQTAPLCVVDAPAAPLRVLPALNAWGPQALAALRGGHALADVLAVAGITAEEVNHYRPFAPCFFAEWDALPVTDEHK